MSGRVLKRIRQLELLELEGLRARAQSLEAELARLNAEISSKENDILDRVRGGASVEKGEVQARAAMEHKPARCSPPWKAIYLAHMLTEHGRANDIAENEQRALHPAGPGETKYVLVLERAASQ